MRKLLVATTIAAATAGLPRAEAQTCIGAQVIVNGTATGSRCPRSAVGYICAGENVVHMPPPLTVAVSLCVPKP